MKHRILIAFLSVVGLIALTGCDSSKPKTSSEPAQILTVGIYAGDLSSLIWIADEKGYFAEHGLKVDIRNYDSGMAATRDLLEGKVDLSTPGDFVVAGLILRQSPVRIISSMCEADGLRLVARRDHGITKASDLRNKRIGMLKGSVGEFFLDLLLVVNGIPFEEIHKIDLSPSEQVKAILGGRVDAVVAWEPFVTSICNELGENAFNESAQSGQNYNLLLLGMEDTIKRRSTAVQSFVASLISAEEFLKSHKDEARVMVAKKLGLEDPGALWGKTSFEVCLDHPLMLTLEAQIRWMAPDLASRQSDMPNLLKFMYLDALKSIQPDRIKIIY